ncbi:MAG: hypothetical protein GQ535_11120 [Rhodobacteraceae bacterium]|nr:hypothetical protein [Paracoccaceae bacterium]
MAEYDASLVANPDQNPAHEEYGDGWGKTIGWFNGLAGLTGSIQRVTSTGAAISEDVARGIDAQRQLQYDRENHDQDLLLDKLKITRGDNVQLYYALAAGAVALIFLIK